MTVAIFDSVAGEYDAEFTDSALGRDLRAIVWERLEANFKTGDRVLELNCGTGEDAVWMAKRGILVLATDISDVMLHSTARKAAARGFSGTIETQHLDLARPEILPRSRQFDGVLSNFGGLNCIGDLRPLASMLGEQVVPGGRLIMVFMGRHCVWEIAWHSLHLRPGKALRRMRRNPVKATIGRDVLPVWYPAPGFVRRIFEPWFAPRRMMGLGVFLPPTYLTHLIANRPGLHRLLSRLERGLSSRFPFSDLGDHTIFEFERIASKGK